MVVYTSKPTLHIHNMYVHLWEVLPVLGLSLFNSVFVHQRLIPIPLVRDNLCVMANVSLKEGAERCCRCIVYNLT